MGARQTRRIVELERPFKTCTVCKRELPTLAFTKHARSKDGLNYHCITCQKVKSAERRHGYVSNAGRY